MADLDYYCDLLIKQYYDKPKARATIRLLASLLPAIPLEEMYDAYGVDTAFGQQLSVLAKWVGCNRNYPSPRFKSGCYFAQPRIRGSSIESTDALQSGFQKFNYYEAYNGPFLTTQDFDFEDNMIDDSDLQLLIKMKIIKNCVRATVGNIDSAVYAVFGNDIYTTWDVKELTYNCTPDYTSALEVGRINDWLPRPTDCRIIINEVYN